VTPLTRADLSRCTDAIRSELNGCWQKLPSPFKEVLDEPKCIGDLDCALASANALLSVCRIVTPPDQVGHLDLAHLVCFTEFLKIAICQLRK
jgi:hypothetical protein